jgi:AhpD family alkylhydroperoxidase
MTFDSRMTELIALAASVAANCQSCVEYHARKAAESGVDPQEVAQAIDIGRAVRKGAATRIDQVADAVQHKDASPANGATAADAPASAATCCGAASGEASRRDTVPPKTCTPFTSMMEACRSGGFPFAEQPKGKS